MVSLDDIRAAAEGLTGVAHRTPTERSETFTRQCGGEVWLKFENQQRTGSFKIRGAYTKIQSLTPAERAAGVVAPSAGNHAQAVAFAARSAGVDATVYMPEAASLAKVGATEGYGATVRLVGDSVEGSVEAARQAERDEGKTLVHPFDDEVVIAGQGTVGLEILEDVPDLDAVVVPLGGGGLLSGHRHRREDAAPGGARDRRRGGRLRALRRLARARHDHAGAADRDDRRRHRRQAPGRDHLRARARATSTTSSPSPTPRSARRSSSCSSARRPSSRAPARSRLAALLAGKVQAKRAVAVLSGGNIDTPLLMQVIRFGLTNAGRYLVIRTRLIDRPGQLMHLLKVLADSHINILVVSHHRESVDVAVAETGIELILETRDEAHAHEVVELVRRTAATPSRACTSRQAGTVPILLAGDLTHLLHQGAVVGRPQRRVGGAQHERDQRGVVAPDHVADDDQRRRRGRAITSRPVFVTGCGSSRSAFCHTSPKDASLSRPSSMRTPSRFGAPQLAHAHEVEAAVARRDHGRRRPQPVVQPGREQRQRGRGEAEDERRLVGQPPACTRRQPARDDGRQEDGAHEHGAGGGDAGRRAHRPRPRAITIRWTSLVPSPISSTFWSR